MPRKPLPNQEVVVSAACFAGFGVAHLIDDFLYGVPAEFHLSNQSSQLLGLLFFASLSGLIALAATGSRQSYLGLAIIGSLLAVADITKHVPEMVGSSSWHSGIWSEVFSIGLVLSAATTAVVSFRAWRRTGKGIGISDKSEDA